MNPRAEIFAAVRAHVPQIWNDPGNILAMDNLLDAFGVPREVNRTINAAGLKIIKDSEGCVLTSYRDPVGILTIGYGSTGDHVKPGMTITAARAESLLLEDLARFEAGVAALTPDATDNQFSAMVSLAFNIGLGAFKGSTLLARHRVGDHAGAQAQFARWNKAGGKVLKGLVTRRAKEAALYGAAT